MISSGERLNVRSLKALIAKNNAKFAEMPPAEKRVAIAVDVLAQLKSKKLVGETGAYLKSTALARKSMESLETSASELFNDAGTCKVCAIGAAFFCSVQKLDQVKMKDLFDPCVYRYEKALHTRSDDDDLSFIKDDVMRDYLVASGAFTRAQLGAVEAAFEGWHPHHNFNCCAKNDREALRRIFEFIRDNKGSVNFPKKCDKCTMPAGDL